MNKTKIEYLTHTWNPLAMRCTPVSKGCANCWHLRMADRLAKNPKMPEFKRNIYAGGYKAEMVAWNHPMGRKQPAVIGVQFMGDIAHESVEGLDFYLVFDMMAMCQQHTFVVLTKRPKRMAELLHHFRGDRLLLDNIWLGVTVEDQETADERIPQLLQIPAAHYWASYEPALESTVFDDTWLCSCMDCGNKGSSAIFGNHPGSGLDLCRACKGEEGPSIEFVVAGGESGPGARPAHPDWFRSVRDQCAAAGVPFFMKQMARREPIPDDLMVRQLPWEMP